MNAELDRLVLEGAPPTALDVGCGEGEQAARLAGKGLSVCGVDLAPAMVDAARARGVEAQVADVLHLPFADATFDRVIVRYVLYHVSGDNLDDALTEIGRVLTPNGRLVAATISQAFMDTVGSLLGEPDPPRLSFSLEHGRALLEHHFRHVERVVVDERLHFANHADVRDYLCGTVSWAGVANRLAPFDGPLILTNPVAIFLAED